MADFVDEGIGVEGAGQQLPLVSAEDCDGEGHVISARGTEDGLIIRIDGRSEWETIVTEMKSFLGERRRFLEGGEVSLEWLDQLPTKEQSKILETLLRDEYQIEIIPRRKRPPKLVAQRKSARPEGEEDESSAEAIPLFDSNEQRRYVSKKPGDLGVEGLTLTVESEDGDSEISADQLRRITELLGEDAYFEEEANARVVFGTLRSGQRVETPYSLVVIGDVNPGADLIAGGDIIIVGGLRGTAHASAYDDEAQDRVIIALHMQPMQLRIGSVISRGSDEAGRGAEIARIEDRRIIVEGFHPRLLAGKRYR